MIRRPFLYACAVAMSGGICTPAKADIADNSDYKDAYTNWGAVELVLLPTAFLPGPFGAIADLSTIAIDIRLRYLPAWFIAPGVSPKTPNSNDSCHYKFELPQKSADYGNLLSLWDIKPLAADWGALGTPQVEHHNSSVKVSVDAPALDSWTDSARDVSFGSGVHHLRWKAETQLDPIFDIALPTVLFVYSAEFKYGEAITKTDPKSAARAFAIGKEFLKSVGIAAGVIAAGTLSETTVTTATHEQDTDFTVYDVRPPTISTSQPNPAPLEATRFGGERWFDHFAKFRATVTAADPCELTPSVGNDAPDFLPIGTTNVTWTAHDIGPLGGGNTGLASVVQTIVVQDTLPPILLAPPSRVVESNVPPLPSDINIGSAVVFDLADPEPDVNSTAPTSFPVDSRTEVSWTATDDSGNSSQKSQWVTVKTPGTNTPPSVQNLNANTLTSESVNLVLSGSDADLLSGRFDPLNFRIVQDPANGFFVAPLQPYFIEDYRVRPGDLVGDILNFSNNPASDLYDAFCNAQPNQPVPVDFPYRAIFVHLRDDDQAYILDEAWRCTNGFPVTDPRISMWDADGNLIASTSAGFGFRDVNRVTLDSQGELQAVSPSSNSEWLVLRRYEADLLLFQSWELRDKQPLNRSMKHVSAVYDPDTGVIYASDKQYVYVYDGLSGGTQPPYIGALNGGAGFLSRASGVAGSSSAGFTMEIDSTGALYLPDPGSHRVYKFEPSSFDGTTFIPGDMVGWMGRCDSGPNCDDENGRSFGYSCTDASCTVSTAYGSDEGQFDTPLGMALDPNDILYVTDYNNSRVQRFTPLGDFAGQAASTCDGGCFVLGDMGRPVDISVNANKFHVLDRDNALLHVFETAPFKEINDASVTVEYSSDNSFQGTDTFQFRANDGLANSNTGTATIEVMRNFRPPEALASEFELNEDNIQPFTLQASDPDGIAGVDFNGLDTLQYTLVDSPEHGSVSGSGVNLVYTPDPDYSGTDRLSFVVNDGLFTSAEAEVSFNMLPVNDPPVVAFTDQTSRFIPKAAWPMLQNKIMGDGLTAGRGFPIPLLAEYFDPDPAQDENHFVQVLWGDGSSNSANDTTPLDPDDPDPDPIITPGYNSEGQVIGKHIYINNGQYTVNVTVLDKLGTSGDAQTTITVIDMVDLTIESSSPVNPLPQPGSDVSMTFTVVNAEPAGGVTGINATNVVFKGTLPPGASLLGANSDKGSCTHNDPVTQCNIGTLLPGESATITVNLRMSVDFNPEELGYDVDISSDQQDASGDNLTKIAIPVLGQTIFKGGFEQ